MFPRNQRLWATNGYLRVEKPRVTRGKTRLNAKVGDARQEHPPRKRRVTCDWTNRLSEPFQTMADLSGLIADVHA